MKDIIGSLKIWICSQDTQQNWRVWSKVPRMREGNGMRPEQWPGLHFCGLGDHGKESGLDSKCHRNPLKGVKYRHGSN